MKIKIKIIDGSDVPHGLGADIVEGIVRDLVARPGLRQVWGMIESDVRAGVWDTWSQIAEDAVRRGMVSPEAMAMLQALYSRSPASVDEHLEKVRDKGADKFMGSYYVGYGHASIGDCGVTTIFLEGVTMLAAKAVQDWPLYSGQEASTRYMDFSESEFSNPADSVDGEVIQERWREFYLYALGPVRQHLRDQYPPADDERDGRGRKRYEQTIAARSFDILRGFLPAGAHTNLSWTTNLRQASDKLRWLRHHPSKPIRELAENLIVELRAKYPNSFGDRSLKEAREGGETTDVEKWFGDVSDHYMYPPVDGGTLVECRLQRPLRRVYLTSDLVDELTNPRPGTWAQLLANRPRGAELPPWMADLGTIRSEFPLDFGSYRDIQRHRNGTIRMPLLTTRMGFHPWYLDQLPEELRDYATGLLDRQCKAIRQLNLDPVDAQDYIAMGYRVPVVCTQTLPAFIYRLEIRSSKSVHPTLRTEIHREIAWFRQQYPGIALHVDDDPSWWTTRRGEQTIEERS